MKTIILAAIMTIQTLICSSRISPLIISDEHNVNLKKVFSSNSPIFSTKKIYEINQNVYLELIGVGGRILYQIDENEFKESDLKIENNMKPVLVYEFHELNDKIYKFNKTALQIIIKNGCSDTYKSKLIIMKNNKKYSIDGLGNVVIYKHKDWSSFLLINSYECEGINDFYMLDVK